MYAEFLGAWWIAWEVCAKWGVKIISSVHYGCKIYSFSILGPFLYGINYIDSFAQFLIYAYYSAPVCQIDFVETLITLWTLHIGVDWESFLFV